VKLAAPTLRAVPLAIPARVRRRLFVLGLLAALLGVLYLAWLRDSSLVQVRKVSVVGLSGPQAPRLREILRQAGLQQTTLHLDVAKLRRAVAGSPEIETLTATPDFPHGLRIDVTENHPVAVLVVAGKGRLPVAANGTLMPGGRSAASVPQIAVGALPTASAPGTLARLRDARAEQLLSVAAAAPPALLARTTAIGVRKGDGIVAQLQGGPRIVFGDATQIDAKWAAAAGVLASPGSSGASYVDVRLPGRPVAGGLRVPPADPSTGAAATTAPATPVAPAVPVPAQAAPAVPAPSPVSPAAPATTTPAAPVQTVPATPQTGTPAAPSNTQP
jgi:cell division protein FtsQ